MKQGFKALRLTVFLFVALSIVVFSVSANEPPVNLQSVILDRFNGETTHQWTIGGKTLTHEFEWRTVASRFASTIDGQSFPQLGFVPAWPQAVFGVNREGADLRSLGLWGKFDRLGDNWIDIYPTVVGSGAGGAAPTPFEIPIPGRIRSIDMWVWGANLHYNLEVFVRDYRGIVHAIPMGSLAFDGWQNLQVQIPTNIPQTRRTLPRYAGLQLVKFRVWTTRTERVDNFFIYFNQLQILTDVFEALFDGNDLADPERVQELWGQAQAQ